MVLEKFKDILKKEQVDSLIPFLKSLDKPGKKEIASSLKQLKAEYLDFQPSTSLVGLSYKQKASPDQKNILCSTAFFCLNRKEYEKFESLYYVVDKYVIEQILPWYCPDWFSDLINDLVKRDWIPWNFRYNEAMELAEKGYINPSDELISKLIPQMIFDQGTNHQNTFAPQNLEKRMITLEKHIWLIFQFETSIHYSDRYLNFQNSTKEVGHWLVALKDCCDRGKLNRIRLLKESILATNRNFNKALAGWFVDLFEYLEPLPQELMELQPELLNILSSQHSKAVNCALNAFKSLVTDDGFNKNGFLESVPILLSSETKTVVNSTLILLEKLLRKHPDLKEGICINVCHALIHNDENIQNKVSKILLKYHDGSSTTVTEEIKKYQDSLLMSSKKMLSDFISEIQESNIVLPPPVNIGDELPNPIQAINSIDELIFLASQSFDNNDPLHIDLLPASLVNLQGQLVGSELHKFEAALQRAYSTVMSDWPANMGYLDHLLATFFIDFTKILIERFPDDSKSLTKVHDTYKKKDEENKTKWRGYNSRILEFSTWSVESRDTTYLIYKTILMVAYQKIRDKDHAPILSTPTHENGYLDPVELVERLAINQEKKVDPEDCDFQLAISRIASFNHARALEIAQKKLTGETLRVIEFLLIKESGPMPPFNTPSIWFLAGVTKSPKVLFQEFSGLFYSTLPQSTFTGDVPWKSFVEHYHADQYNYKTNTMEKIPSQRSVLRLTLNPTPKIWRETEKKEGLFSRLSSMFTGSKSEKRSQPYLLYEYLSLKSRFISAEQNDIQRFICLFPSNPNPVLALVAARSLEHSTFFSEVDKKLVTKTLESIINLRFQFSEITHLFVGSCALTSDKTIRSYAAELWTSAVQFNMINGELLGQIIGKHLGVGYAPLKRFTDLVSSNLIQISPLHNQALETVLSSVISELPSEPLTGTKKLLELYSETLAVNNSKVKSVQIKGKLEVWSLSNSLKKIAASLI